MNEILFFSPHLSARLRYVCQLLFGDLLGLHVNMTNDVEIVALSALPMVCYAAENGLRANAAHIFWLPFSGSNIFENHTFLPIMEQEKDFFSIQQHDTINFDVLARIFYLISRMEEYEPNAKRDEHERYSAAQSVAARFNFLNRPVVNEYAQIIYFLLQKQFPTLKMTLPKFEQQFTYDVDMAWMFLHKNAQRTAATTAKKVFRGDWAFLKTHLQVISGKMTDPYFVFDWLEVLHEKSEKPPIFFWLLGNYNRFDKNIDVRTPDFQRLIRRMSDKYPIGLHPSYASNDSIEQLQIEQKRIENITEKKCTRSRQHFLKLSLPKTYRNLLEIGITDDYSMGYADASGLRASIATPFKWYDLERETATELTIHPFAAMDVTLKNYLHLSCENAFQMIETLKKTVQTSGGIFTTLWHNSSFSESEGWSAEWRKSYENFVLTSH